VHVDSAIGVDGDDGSVAARRLGQLVDLVSKGGDVLSGLAQGVVELLVPPLALLKPLPFLPQLFPGMLQELRQSERYSTCLYILQVATQYV